MPLYYLTSTLKKSLHRRHALLIQYLYTDQIIFSNLSVTFQKYPLKFISYYFSVINQFHLEIFYTIADFYLQFVSKNILLY